MFSSIIHICVLYLLAPLLHLVVLFSVTFSFSGLDAGAFLDLPVSPLAFVFRVFFSFPCLCGFVSSRLEALAVENTSLEDLPSIAVGSGGGVFSA